MLLATLVILSTLSTTPEHCPELYTLPDDLEAARAVSPGDVITAPGVFMPEARVEALATWIKNARGYPSTVCRTGVREATSIADARCSEEVAKSDAVWSDRYARAELRASGWPGWKVGVLGALVGLATAGSTIAAIVIFRPELVRDR